MFQVFLDIARYGVCLDGEHLLEPRRPGKTRGQAVSADSMSCRQGGASFPRNWRDGIPRTPWSLELGL